MKKKIRVVIADDSALMRKKISEILNNDPDIEVVGRARNGREALDLIYSLKPDVVTLDVEMPELNGIETLGYIMSEFPLPCVMISAFTKEGSDETIRSLEFGAVDFIAKPGGVISMKIEEIAQEIVDKVKLASTIPTNKLKLIWIDKAREKEPLVKKPDSMLKLFAVASSTGGTQALATILPDLRSDLPASIIVVQHMPEGFTKTLSERLNWQSKISIVEAEDGMLIKPAQVIIAKGGMHLEVLKKQSGIPYISLNENPAQLGVRPNANIMMNSAVKVFKEKTVGVVLTGMGTDGTLGAQAIKSAGGKVITEDKDSCVVYGMPKSVVDAGLSDKSVPLRFIAHEMQKMVE